jgi:hypothetical protein
MRRDQISVKKTILGLNPAIFAFQDRSFSSRRLMNGLIIAGLTIFGYLQGLESHSVQLWVASNFQQHWMAAANFPKAFSLWEVGSTNARDPLPPKHPLSSEYYC